MKLEVIRFNKGEDSTNGILFDITDERKFLCYTLEDESREEKVYGETCIPEGEYQIKFRNEGGYHAKYSKRFADIHMGMLEVCDVPNFKYILLHCGNTDEDTAGCLLLGDTQENNDIKTNGFIGKSTQAYKRVYQKIAKALKEEKVTITYRDFSECLLLSPLDVATFVGGFTTTLNMYTYNIEVLRVIDGDTIDASIDLGFDVKIKKRIRFMGINTPESRTRDLEEKKRGLAAKQRVAELLDTATEVQVISHGVGKFGRCLGEIDFCCPNSLTMKNLNKTLIEEGHAVEYHGGKR